MNEALRGATPWSAESDDATLVRCVVAGEARAFEMIMRRHNRRLFRLARAVMRNGCDRIVAGVLARICTPTLAELRCSLPPEGAQ